ncbi:hypothetical protein [Streptomyces sp. DH37]|uniref:hypothetical protein n=1 Tax=Streptomyces sp. DH37 TaxID=3040122 RepID=UPI0024429443|nr:hypothetical protein [Streptomyces sp. DH37]MDG9702933.1 hypothetical protein [Streptomyces sp. DH37]
MFAPFHYGYWDQPGTDGAAPDGHPRAANELTITEWDPVSKQPLFKVGAVRVTRISGATGPSPTPTTTASAPADPDGIPATAGGPDAEVVEQVNAAAPVPRQPSARPRTVPGVRLGGTSPRARSSESTQDREGAVGSGPCTCGSRQHTRAAPHHHAPDRRRCAPGAA